MSNYIKRTDIRLYRSMNTNSPLVEVVPMRMGDGFMGRNCAGCGSSVQIWGLPLYVESNLRVITSLLCAGCIWSAVQSMNEMLEKSPPTTEDITGALRVAESMMVDDG